MDHSLESEVDLLGADDLGDILFFIRTGTHGSSECSTPYARIIGLKKSDFDALVLEETLGLSQIQWGMVWRGVPSFS